MPTAMLAASLTGLIGILTIMLAMMAPSGSFIVATLTGVVGLLTILLALTMLPTK